MSFSLNGCTSIIKFDDNKWKKPKNDENVYIICDNNILHSHNNDNLKPTIFIISGANFNRYFSDQLASIALHNEISLPRDIKPAVFNHNSNRFKIDFTDITLIGHGGFGKVYLATNTVDLYKYAIKKVIFKRRSLKKNNFKQMVSEFRILASLHHPNVVRYHTAWFEKESITIEHQNEDQDMEDSDSDNSRNNQVASTQGRSSLDSLIVFESTSLDQITNNENYSGPSSNLHDSKSRLALDSTSSKSHSFQQSQSNGVLAVFSRQNSLIEDQLVLYIQMELCDETLKDWLDVRNNLPGGLALDDKKTTISLARQLLTATDYIHSNNIIHRDIKPANIFLRRHTSCGNSTIQLKIGDFGLAKSLVFKDSGDGCQRMSANVGTGLYTAPEVFNLRRQFTDYNHKCDLYSVGVILLEMMMKFTTMSELSFVIADISRTSRCDSLSDSWPSETPYIVSLLSSNVEKRPEAAFILNETIAFKESTIENSMFDRIQRLEEENRALRMKLESLEKELLASRVSAVNE